MPLVERGPHHPVVQKRADQSRRLRRAHPRYFFHVGAHYTPLPLAQLAIVLRSQHRLHPGVFLAPSAPPKLDGLAGLEKLPNLFLALGSRHSACALAPGRATPTPLFPFSCSSCIGNRPRPFPTFMLILRWTILVCFK